MASLNLDAAGDLDLTVTGTLELESTNPAQSSFQGSATSLGTTYIVDGTATGYGSTPESSGFVFGGSYGRDWFR